MHKILNTLRVFTIFLLYIQMTSNAYAVGLGTPAANVNQNNFAVSRPVQNYVPAASANQNTMAAVGYHSLPKNLIPKDPVVIAQETGDCVDSKGPLRSQGAFGEQTFCPDGYIPHAIESTDTPTGGFIYRVIENAVGTVYYRLRCCKAYVSYS